MGVARPIPGADAPAAPFVRELGTRRRGGPLSEADGLQTDSRGAHRLHAGHGPAASRPPPAPSPLRSLGGGRRAAGVLDVSGPDPRARGRRRRAPRPGLTYGRAARTGPRGSLRGPRGPGIPSRRLQARGIRLHGHRRGRDRGAALPPARPPVRRLRPLPRPAGARHDLPFDSGPDARLRLHGSRRAGDARQHPLGRDALRERPPRARGERRPAPASRDRHEAARHALPRLPGLRRPDRPATRSAFRFFASCSRTTSRISPPSSRPPRGSSASSRSGRRRRRARSRSPRSSSARRRRRPSSRRHRSSGDATTAARTGRTPSRTRSGIGRSCSA